MIAMLNTEFRLTTGKFLLFFASTILTFQSSCKKLIEIDAPVTSITGKNVYTNDATAAAVLTGLYTSISGTYGISAADPTSIGFLTGLSSDELTLYSGSSDPRLIAYYKNSLTPTNMGSDVWSNIYPKIFIVNSVIEGVSSSTSLTPAVKQQLLGEAKFMRGFLFFYLVNLYGDVPLVTTTNYAVNNVLSRTPEAQVWLQIFTDLNEAKELLISDYLDATLIKKTNERVRPNRWAATCLLARSYLYKKQWKNAELQATEVIDNSGLYKLDSLNGVFLRNSFESIWQLQPVNFGANTEDARTYVIPETGPSYMTPVYVSDQLLNSFELNDKRKNNWISSIVFGNKTYNFPYKYKVVTQDAPVTEYHTIFRLGEQYLIRAEARAQQNNLEGSLKDLNIIRNRAGLKESKISSQSLLLTAIYHERRVELFTEWGHRWLDLKRTQAINTVMDSVTPIKGGKWSSNWQLYPIPPNDILVDGNLIQNAGY